MLLAMCDETVVRPAVISGDRRPGVENKVHGVPRGSARLGQIAFSARLCPKRSATHSLFLAIMLCLAPLVSSRAACNIAMFEIASSIKLHEAKFDHLSQSTTPEYRCIHPCS
jgi:hypothetical protein